MGKAIIAPGKKRVMVTLTEASVTRFQELCREGNLPSATMSHAIDDFIKEMVGMFEHVKKTGKLTIADIFRQMATQMELIHEEGKDVKQAPKNEGMAKIVKRKK